MKSWLEPKDARLKLVSACLILPGLLGAFVGCAPVLGNSILERLIDTAERGSPTDVTDIATRLDARIEMLSPGKERRYFLFLRKQNEETRSDYFLRIQDGYNLISAQLIVSDLAHLECYKYNDTVAYLDARLKRTPVETPLFLAWSISTNRSLQVKIADTAACVSIVMLQFTA